MIRAVAKHTLFLGGAGALWVAFLWFVLAPRFSAWPPPALIAAHLMPPLGVWAGWLGLRWRRHRREAVLAAERERQRQAEQAAALAEARARHEQELARRRYGCDCRGLVVVTPAAIQEVLLPDVPGVRVAAPEGMAAPVPLVEQALRELCAVAPAAAVFPVFIQPPMHAGAEEAVELAGRCRAAIAEALGLPSPGREAPVRLLPVAESVANAVIGLFEAAPDLPGAVVLAWDGGEIMEHDAEPEASAFGGNHEAATGTAVALFLTHTDFAAMLEAVEGGGPAAEDAVADALTPFWLRKPRPVTAGSLLGRLPLPAREALRALPVLARIHRAATARAPEAEERPSRFARLIETLLGQACVDAGLADLPFAKEGDPAPEDAGPAEWGWLVHNAGPVDRAGTRLAALGSAMSRYGSDLHPIDMATNVSTRLGAKGSVVPAAMLALTVGQAAALGRPVLCSEFRGGGSVGLFFAVPARTN